MKILGVLKLEQKRKKHDSTKPKKYTVNLNLNFPVYSLRSLAFLLCTRLKAFPLVTASVVCVSLATDCF